MLGLFVVFMAIGWVCASVICVLYLAAACLIVLVSIRYLYGVSLCGYCVMFGC